MDGGGGAAPVWLRLVRTGSDFAAYRSSNGTSWTLVGRDTISMRDAAYVGLAVASDLPARTATAVFSSVTLNVGGLPDPWRTKAVGAIESGDAAYSTGVFTVEGARGGFGGTADKFQFVYQPVAGDIEITARLTTLASSAGNGKAGVTIRAGLGKSTRHVTMLGSSESGWEFRRRVRARTSSDRTAGPAGRPPGWIRLVREGDLFTAYHSADGSRWTMVDSDRIPMPDTVYIGLVVSGAHPSVPAIATFDNVLLRTPMTTNDPPEVSILSPAAGTHFSAGGFITVKAAATDADGVIAGVDFFVGPVQIGTDATAPYSATVSAPSSGSYTLSAVARDADGASTAASVDIVVGLAPPGDAATLEFEPSPDHAQNVTSYSVAVYRATDSMMAAPLGESSLGKPIPVDGKIAVDISVLLSTLPAGTYRVVVTAIGDGGSTPSLPSAPFDK
jgi:regulation of enolase protein 1 (concanavalin A-like superfamily)